MVTQTPERQYPQRMINSCSSIASYQATSNQSNPWSQPSRTASWFWSPPACPISLIFNIWYTCQGGDPVLWEQDSTAPGCCEGATVSREMVSPLIAVGHVSLVVWPVCSTMILVWFSIVVRQPLSICRLTFFFPFPADIWQIWSLLSPANNPFLELSHLFHLCSTCFFSLCVTQTARAPSVLCHWIWGQTS